MSLGNEGKREFAAEKSRSSGVASRWISVIFMSLFASILLGSVWSSMVRSEPPSGGVTGAVEPPTMQPAAKVSKPMKDRQVQGGWCRYPEGRPRAPQPPEGVLRLLGVLEAEPNNTVETAQVLPLGTAQGQDVDLNVTGSASSAGDVDFYRFSAQKGDIIGVAVVGVGSMDPVTTLVRGSDGSAIFLNDDFEFHTFIFPESAPWPGGDQFTDSAMTYVVPVTGQYLVRVQAFSGLSTGDYQLRLRSRKPNLHKLESPGQQIVFLDFDGANINVCEIFGCFPPLNPPFRTLSPLAGFLPSWGLNANQESAVIDAIIAVVKENFDSLRLASLNGNLDAGDPPGSFDVIVLNSRDHMDPFGQPNVTRVIIGGTVDEFTIDTIGLAQFIDPGNYAPEDTSVVLLDYLSAAPGGSPICCSINDLPRAPGFTMVQAVGVVVGNIVSHELGHCLGNWHSTVLNGVTNIMDEGGNILALAGAGVDGVLGTGDDADIDFIPDTFSTFEGLFIGTNSTDVNTAFGLATGALPAVPPTLLNVLPIVDSDLGELGQITVTFSEPVLGVTAAALRVNGVAASSVSGAGGGPYLFQGFIAPGDGPAVVELAAGQIRDGVGNTFTGGNWQYQIRDCNANRVLDTTEIEDGLLADCNDNGVPDVCEAGVLRSQTVPAATIAAGQSIQLGEYLPFIGGQEPIEYEWELRGNPSGEVANGFDPSYGPLQPGTYVVKATAADSAGCQAVGFVTVFVLSSGGDGGEPNGNGNTNGAPNPNPNGNNNLIPPCGDGVMCGATGGGMTILMTLIGSSVGLRVFSRRSRRR